MIRSFLMVLSLSFFTTTAQAEEPESVDNDGQKAFLLAIAACPKPAPTEFTGLVIDPNQVRGRKALDTLSEYDETRLDATTRAHRECVLSIAKGMTQVDLGDAAGDQIRKDKNAVVHTAEIDVKAGPEGGDPARDIDYRYYDDGRIRYAAPLGVQQYRRARNDEVLSNQRYVGPAPAPANSRQNVPAPSAEDLEREAKAAKLRAAKAAAQR